MWKRKKIVMEVRGKEGKGFVFKKRSQERQDIRHRKSTGSENKKKKTCENSFQYHRHKKKTIFLSRYIKKIRQLSYA